MSKKTDLLKDLKLVNYKSHEGHDGDGFNATIVYQGVKIATVHDDAWGGEYQYECVGAISLDNDGKYHRSQELKDNRIRFNALEKRVKELPREYSEEHDFHYDPSLDTILDDMTKVLEQRKHEKKGILVKHPSGFLTVGYSTSIPHVIKKYKDGLEAIQKLYDKQIAEGKTVLNTVYLESQGINI